MSSTLPAGPRPRNGRALPIDHLRAVLILLVVAHHAVLAYVSYAPEPTAAWDATAMIWRAFPIVDAVRAPSLDLLVAFNDAVLMALLFFVAGLFTWSGLQGKGSVSFLKRRTLRLGLPFVVATGLFAPLAYYPAYLQHGGDPALRNFVDAWLGLPVWPSGPAWFLWVLLSFSALAALSYRLAPRWGQRLGARLGSMAEERPWRFFALWVAASAVIYVPVTLWINPMTWFELGPLTAQTSRLGLYALYFVFGIALGAYGVRRGLLSPQGRLAQRWMAWQGIATLCLFIMLVCVITVFVQLDKGTLHPAMPILASLAFVLSCAASSWMLLAFFLHFERWGGPVWRSLSRNAFGIYLVHYVYVTWIQQSLLDVSLPALAKAGAVFMTAAALSWGTSIALRRIPGVGRIL